MQRSTDIVNEGKRLREIREALKLSREQMAGRLGVAPMTLKGAENGSQRLAARKFLIAESLADGLDVAQSASKPSGAAAVHRTALDMEAVARAVVEGGALVKADQVAAILGVDKVTALSIVLSNTVSP